MNTQKEFMREFAPMKMKNKYGFTLMEMLIVVAIISVLVVIAITTYSSSNEKAKEAADLSNIRSACAEMLTVSALDEKYDRKKFEKYKASDGTNYMKTYVNCVSNKTGWQINSSQKKGNTILMNGAYLIAPTTNKPVVRIRLNLDTGVFDFNPENEDTGNKRIGVYNRS